MLLKYVSKENGENTTEAYLYTLQSMHNQEETRKFLNFP